MAWVVGALEVSGCRGTQGCTGLECGSLSLGLTNSCQLCASKTRYCPQSRRLCLCARFSQCPKTAEAFIAVQHFSPSVGSGQDPQDCQRYLSRDNPPRGRLGLLNHPRLDAAPFWGTGDQQNPPAIRRQPFCTKSFRIPLCKRHGERSRLLLQTQGRLVVPEPDSPPDLGARIAPPWEICHGQVHLERARRLNSSSSACRPEWWGEVLTLMRES